MIFLELRKRIRELLNEKATLLWLEGSKFEPVNHVNLKTNKLILTLENGTIKLVQFDRYSFTKVGIQFWSKGRPGVLYKWDIPEITSNFNKLEADSISTEFPDDDPTPPGVAA